MLERFTRRDFVTLAFCVVVFTAGLAVSITLFDRAFPEASISFRYDRESSRPLAQRFAKEAGANIGNHRHAAAFRHDGDARIFLERTLGVERANDEMRRGAKVWFWTHRWFRPLQQEELQVDIAPTGELVSLRHVVAEDAAAPIIPASAARARAEAFLQSAGVDPASLNYLNASEKRLPRRIEQIFTWESTRIQPGGAPYRYSVTVRGSSIAAFKQHVRVPDEWLRDYSELRSKNIAAGFVDQLFLLLTMLAALVVFILRLRNDDLQRNFSLIAGAVAAVLVTATGLNGYPNELVDYDTNQSFASFVTSFIVINVLQGVVSGLFLMVIVGAGEALFRQHYPQHLAIPRLFNRNALRSKRVFLGFVIGYALFAAFLAYQVVFYIVASKYGAWSPADIPYDDAVNTAFPWIAVLLMGFFPAVSEEFMSRAFSIPLFEKLFRSRVAAIVIAGFIWGFGHATYPNQPFYIRGLEVGIAGVVIGLLMTRVGLLPLLVWHYTIDALYTSLLLFRSGNAYYISSAAAASLLFVVPLVVSLFFYFRHGGFLSDEGLENRAIGSKAPVEEPERDAVPGPLPPPPVKLSPVIALAMFAVAAIAIGTARRTPSASDVIDYAISEDDAVVIAREQLKSAGYAKLPSNVLVMPVGGFRSWDESGGREEGGHPTGYDAIAANYVVSSAKKAPHATLNEITLHKVEAATWLVRFYEPQQKEEFLVEVDPRTRKAIGFHRFLDEAAPGPKLERQQAEAVGVAVLQRYGVGRGTFELKEALSYEQPERRDWLLHFEERSPLVAGAFRRAHVRIAGNQLTQFTKTIRIPEAAERLATEHTLLNTLLFLLKLAGVVTLGIIIISGGLIAARENGFAWRWAVRAALFLAPLPLLVSASRWRAIVSSYSTTQAWATFTTMAAVSFAGTFLMSLLATWLSFAAIRTARPEAPRYLALEGRRRFGRDAVLRAITAVATATVIAVLLDLVADRFPALFPVGAIDPSSVANDPFPAVGTLWTSFTLLLFATACFACVSALMRTTSKRTMVIAATIASIFIISIDSTVMTHQILATLFSSLIAALVAGFLLFRLLAPNPLAYPVTAAILLAFQGAAELWESNRIDLQINATCFTVVAVAVLIWLAWPRSEMSAESEPRADVGSVSESGTAA